MKNTIGIFDSGVGGLTVLQTMMKDLPHTDLMYIGDNKNCPYGDKSKAALYECASKVVEYFIAHQIKIIVLACNTTSANVLEELRAAYPNTRIIGVIDSTVQNFLRKEKEKVLVIATKATIDSHKYQDTIALYNKQVQVNELATPKLVPLIESGKYKKGIQETIKEYVTAYQGKIDSIILGCTHYPIIANQFKEVLKDICYISSSESVSKEVAYYLSEHHLIDTQHTRQIEINTTGDVEDFKFAAGSFFDFEEIKVHHIEV
ncbi:glutamate racemase [Beduini massiliensis]|uniref:glutamate racemase n=1 Tax=Beduini massiliensis TaxID=1585974 RepID=UPI00059A8E3E|nr:glutamate racemase [Beduini massiliensis]